MEAISEEDAIKQDEKDRREPSLVKMNLDSIDVQVLGFMGNPSGAWVEVLTDDLNRFSNRWDNPNITLYLIISETELISVPRMIDNSIRDLTLLQVQAQIDLKFVKKLGILEVWKYENKSLGGIAWLAKPNQRGI